MEIDKIFFIGNGHGGLAALKGLQKEFSEIGVFSNDPEIIRSIRSKDYLYEAINDIDTTYGLMAGYTKILPKEFVEKKFTLNIHYSLLPHLRGLHSVVWAILNGDREIGWTLHKAEEGIDTGAIYHQSRIENNSLDSAEIMSIFDQMIEEQIGKLALDAFLNKHKGIFQEESNATWVPRRNRDDCLIDFDKTTDELSRLFRALVRPYPLPHIVHKGMRLEVSKAKFITRDYICTNGRVVNITNEGAYVKCANGIVIISELVDESGNVVDWKPILKLGARL